ncbi:MAG: TetR/AcrR family transcriptional regulator [Bacteroidota bacterium]
MNLRFTIRPNEKLALRDPESSELGRKIVRQGLILMYRIGYEHFTFRKLAAEIDTKEASIYRYFENKHRFLLYLLTWHWNILEYTVIVSLRNLDDSSEKIRAVIRIVANNAPDLDDETGLDRNALHGIAMAESSKVYLIKEVDEVNREQLFKPYKDLCGRIAGLFGEYAPAYPYPRSLASTVLEMAQLQPYFAQHLPALTDIGKDENQETLISFLENFVFSVLDKYIPEKN